MSDALAAAIIFEQDAGVSRGTFGVNDDGLCEHIIIRSYGSINIGEDELREHFDAADYFPFIKAGFLRSIPTPTAGFVRPIL
jgi:hypothetical protein